MIAHTIIAGQSILNPAIGSAMMPRLRFRIVRVGSGPSPRKSSKLFNAPQEGRESEMRLIRPLNTNVYAHDHVRYFDTTECFAPVSPWRNWDCWIRESRRSSTASSPSWPPSYSSSSLTCDHSSPSLCRKTYESRREVYCVGYITSSSSPLCSLESEGPRNEVGEDGAGLPGIEATRCIVEADGLCKVRISGGNVARGLL